MADYSFRVTLVSDINPGGTIRVLRNGTVKVYNAATDALIFTVETDQNGGATFTTTDVVTIYLVSPNGLTSEHITAASAIEASAAFTVSEDAAVAALVASPGSSTGITGDGRWVPQPASPTDGDAIVWDADTSAWVPGPAGNPGLEGRVTTLEENSSTLEELSHSVLLTTGTITATTTIPVHVALFPVQVDEVSMAFAADVAGSTSDYWTVTLKRRRVNPATIVTKTTQPVTSGGIGEPVTAFKGWSFAGLTFADYSILAAGDVLAVTFTPTGSPAPLSAPLLTFRTVPTDAASPADPVIVANLVNNSNFAANVTGWTGNAGTLAWQSGAGADGAAGFARLTATATSGRTLQKSTAIAVGDLGQYTVSAYVKSSVAGATARVSWWNLTSGGSFISSANTGALTALTSSWQRLTFTASSLPATTTQVKPQVEFGSTGGAVGDVFDVDMVMFNAGALADYVDGPA